MRVLLRNKKFLLFGAAVLAVVLLYFFSGKDSTQKVRNEFKEFGVRQELLRQNNRSEAYIELGLKQKKANKITEAEKSFRRAIELDPRNALQAYLALDELYRFYLPDKEEGTPELYTFGLIHSPKSRILLRALAQYYERKGEIGRARHWYGKILDYYPDDLPAKRKIESLR